MADRIYGPIRGAGTQIRERQPDRNIVQGVLGSTAFAGVFERGTEGGITICPSKKAMLRKMGDVLDPADFNAPSFASLEAPLNAQHFWDHSEGAGQLTCLRVVPRTNNANNDDRPTKARLDIFNREAVPKYLGYGIAKNGGRWAGHRRTFTGKITGVPGADFPLPNQLQLNGIVAKTAPTFLQRDELKGATVRLHGITGKTYTVVSNTTLGLLSFDADVDLVTDWATAGVGGASAGTVVGTVAAPWNLAPGDTLSIHVDEDGGGPDVATFTATAAIMLGGAVALPPGAGDTVVVHCDLIEEDQTITFSGAEATAALAIAAINEQVRGMRAVLNGVNIDLKSDTLGTDSYVEIVSETGGGAGHIGQAVGHQHGTGNVANIERVTFAEAHAIIEAVCAPAAVVTETVAHYIQIASATTGASSSVQVEAASTADTPMGLDNLKHDGSALSDFSVTVTRDNLNYRGLEKSLSVEWKDGVLDPVGRFGVIFRVDGVKFLDYKELSMDSSSPYYWRDVINNDPNNDIVEIVDSFTGNRLADTARPANRYGTSKALTTQTLTLPDPVISGLSVGAGAWVPNFVFTSWGSLVVAQLLRVECTDPTPGSQEFTITTDIGNRTVVAHGDLAAGIAVDMDDYGIDFTLRTTGGVVNVNDYFYVYLRPLVVSELIGGQVNPNVDASSQRVYTIVSNTRTTVSVSPINDLTDAGANVGGEEFILVWPDRMAGGYDGYIAGMTTADYEALLDSGTSPLKALKSMNQGLVKLAIPGIAGPSPALDLQRKAKDLALAYNWEYRVEVPDEYEDEMDVLDWLNNSFGRIDLSISFFPAFMYIRDPLATAGMDMREKLVSVTGMQLGREALTARQWKGYHKAAAGTEVTLPLVVRAPVLGRPDNPERLNEELLNPAGVNCYRWASGGSTIIAWGDRTLDPTTEYMWKHKREQLSHYENILIENFDWAIFAINDADADADVLASLHTFFLEEYRKRALRGDTFVGGRNPAAIIKMDKENNTDSTRAQGNQNVDISLRFADVVERLNISIGAMGLTER